jgi:hypothetical protein
LALAPSQAVDPGYLGRRYLPREGGRGGGAAGGFLFSVGGDLGASPLPLRCPPVFRIIDPGYLRYVREGIAPVAVAQVQVQVGPTAAALYL